MDAYGRLRNYCGCHGQTRVTFVWWLPVVGGWLWIFIFGAKSLAALSEKDLLHHSHVITHVIIPDVSNKRGAFCMPQLTLPPHHRPGDIRVCLSFLFFPKARSPAIIKVDVSCVTQLVIELQLN